MPDRRPPVPLTPVDVTRACMFEVGALDVATTEIHTADSPDRMADIVDLCGRFPHRAVLICQAQIIVARWLRLDTHPKHGCDPWPWTDAQELARWALDCAGQETP